MFHTTLSKGKHIALRKKERYIIRAQVKGTGKYCVIRAQVKGTGKYCVIRAQVKGTGKYCVIRAQVIGTGICYKPRSRDRVTNCMYTNQPRSTDRAYDLENQSHKTGNNTRF